MGILLLALDVATLLCRLLLQAHAGFCSRGLVRSGSPPVSTGELGPMLPVKVWVQILCEMHLDVLCWNTSLV